MLFTKDRESKSINQADHHHELYPKITRLAGEEPGEAQYFRQWVWDQDQGKTLPTQGHEISLAEGNLLSIRWPSLVTTSISSIRAPSLP